MAPAATALSTAGGTPNACAPPPHPPHPTPHCAATHPTIPAHPTIHVQPPATHPPFMSLYGVVLPHCLLSFTRSLPLPKSTHRVATHFSQMPSDSARAAATDSCIASSTILIDPSAQAGDKGRCGNGACCGRERRAVCRRAGGAPLAVGLADTPAPLSSAVGSSLGLW